MKRCVFDNNILDVLLILISECHCSRQTYTRGQACTYHIWQWQNNCFCCDRGSGVSPSLPVTWGYHKYCKTGSWECSPSSRIPSYPKKSVVMISCLRQHHEYWWIITANTRQWKCPEFQFFVRQMYQMCLACIFELLRPAMTVLEVVRCPDGHFRKVIYSLRPYIADYPEQVWLAGIVQGCKYISTPLSNINSSWFQF